MEIKLNVRDKITISTDCKVTIEDNQIIIEEQKDEFKEGDILVSNDGTRTLIFSHYREDKNLFDSYFNIETCSNSEWVTSNFRHATDGEKQSFFYDLKKEGLRWNAETKTMEKIRRRAKKGKKYLFIDSLLNIEEVTETYDEFDNQNYNVGNYYLLEERKQAERDVKAIRAIFEKRLKVE